MRYILLTLRIIILIPCVVILLFCSCGYRSLRSQFRICYLWYPLMVFGVWLFCGVCSMAQFLACMAMSLLPLCAYGLIGIVWPKFLDQ